MPLRRALVLGLLALCAQAAQARLFLWHAQRGGRSLWLLGSVHLGAAGMYPVPKPIEDAYRHARTLAVEADVSDAHAVESMMPMTQLPRGQRVGQMLSAPENVQLDRTLAKVGLAHRIADHLKPWFLAMTLEAMEMQRLGLSAQYGIDLHYLNAAKSDGKRIVELESVKSQFALFDHMPQADTVAMLEETLAEIQSGRAAREVPQMIAAWHNGDAPALRHLIEGEANADAASARLDAELFGRRNRAMVGKIEALAGDPAPLVVVGAGHLAGPDNLIGMLRKRGFQLTQY